jgi:hypothetical protein
MPKKAVKNTTMPTQAILTREELEFYLSRAVTMAGVGSDPKSNNTLGNEIGVSYDEMRQAHLDFIYRTGAQFIGRVAALWSEWQGNSRFYWAYKFNESVRNYKVTKNNTDIYPLKDIILQCAIFEHISPGMIPWGFGYPDSEIKIPAWVFEEYGLAGRK